MIKCWMSEYIHKSHNVSVLLYHIVCPTKYRRVVISEEVDKTLKEVCAEISKRHEIEFLEIGTEGDHVHFLVQSVPTYSPTKIVSRIEISAPWAKLDPQNHVWGSYRSFHRELI